MNVKSSTLPLFGLFIFFLIVFSLIYSSAIKEHFLMNEDHNFLWTHDTEWVKAKSFSEFIDAQPSEGRFLDNLYYYLIYNKYLNSLKSINSANIIRFAGVIGIAFFALVLYLALREFSVKKFHALSLSIITCTLPPMWRYVSILHVTHLIYSVLLSALSGLILFKVIWREDSDKTAHKIIAVSGAIILLFLSLNIYQPTSMVYWAMAAIPLIKLNEEHSIQKWRFPVFVYFFTGFAAFIIYFATIKIIYFLMDVGLRTRGGGLIISDLFNLSELVNIIHSQLAWFIEYPLYLASSLWKIPKSKEFVFAISIIIFAGILAGLGCAIRQKTKKCKSSNLLMDSLFRHLLIFVLLPMTYLPHLLIKFYDMQPIVLHRTLIGLEIFIILLLYWSISNIGGLLKSVPGLPVRLERKIVTTGLILSTIIVALLANYYTEKYFAGFSADEFRYVKNNIEEYGVNNISEATEIHILTDPAPHIKAVYKLTIFDLTRATSVVEQYAISLVKVTLNELGVNINVPVKFIRTDVLHVPGDNKVLIIDMREFQKKTYKELNRPLTIQSLLKHAGSYLQ